MRYEFGYRYQERFHRNVWGSYGSVRKWASEVGNTDVYSSVFGYSGEITAGVVYAGLYFDLDSPDLSQALEDTNALISIFDNHDITPDSYRVSFSGKKGFHVYVSPVALDVTPSTELPGIFRRLAGEVAELLPNGTLDTHVYDRRRLWRLVNSRHADSGLYKVNLTMPLPTVPEILNFAETARPIHPLNPTKSIAAARWLSEVKPDPPSPPSTIPISSELHPKAVALLNDGVEQGRRNVTCFYLGCYLSAKGWDASQIGAALQAFGRRCSPPLPEGEVESVVRSVLKRRLGNGYLHRQQTCRDGYLVAEVRKMPL